MLRGFRWQFFALLTSAGVFVLALVARLTTTVNPLPAITTTPAVIAVTATPAATAIPSIGDAASTPARSAATIDRPDSLPAYREALIGQVQRLNPLYADLNPVDRDITSLIFEGLTRITPRGEIEGALAERWIISTDGLEYVVYLRQGTAWHDGIPFTSADVAYTMSVLRDPAFTGNSDLGAFWRTVETEVLDTFIVRFRLTQPLAKFLDRLRIGILPEHALRGTNAEALAAHPFNLAPIGTGAYQLEAIRTDGGQVRGVDLRFAPVFRPRPEAQNGRYGLTRVQFTLFDDFGAALSAFQSGAVDGVAARDRNERRALFDLANAAGKTLINGYEPTIGALIMNWGQDNTRYFRDQRIRLALDTGLDRSALIERTLINMAANADSFMLPSFWAYSATHSRPIYDPAAAAALLQTAYQRFAESITPTPTPESIDPASTPEPEPTYLLTFSIMTPDDPSLVRLAEEIASQWTQLNLQVNVERVDLDTYRSRLESGAFDTALIEYTFAGNADPDLYLFWHQGQHPDGLNYGGVDDRRVSELLESIRREPYSVNRRADYAAFQREFAERAIALTLYYPLFTYGVSAQVDNVQLGFLSTPSDRFLTIGDWRLR